MNSLEDKIALITGGGSGIGLAVARLFLREGARVAICGRNEEKLRQAAEAVDGKERLYYRAIEVADYRQVEILVEDVAQRLGPVDILVNNAGVNLRQRRFSELTPENWQSLLRTNLDGAFFCTRAVVPQMRERGGGLVVFIGSVAGLRASPLGGAAYAASKFGMRALGLCLGAEEAASGIRVTLIHPGEVDTPLLDSRPQQLTHEQRLQILKPEDVARAVLFVAALPSRVSVPELVIKPTGQIFI